MYEIYGLSKQIKDKIGEVNKLIYPEDSHILQEALDNIYEENTPPLIEYRIKRKDGKTVYIGANLEKIRNSDGKTIAFVGTAQDVTLHKKSAKAILAAKQRAEESETQFRSLFENAGLGIGYYKPDGTVISYNKIASKNMGGEPEDFSGKSIYDIFPRSEAEFYYKRIEKACITKEPDVYEDKVSLPTGDKYFLSTFSRIIDSKDKILGIQIISQDISEQKNNEIEIIEAKKKAEESDRLKSAFLANMSHEIRTPMNGILGFSELLKKPNLAGDEQKKYIGIIEKSGKRMLNIINDIVDISKIEAGLMELAFEELNVNEQIEYTYVFFKPEAEAQGLDLSFKNSLTTEEATIKTDREKLYAILTNLVKNAIKYTKEGSIEFGYNLKKTNDTTYLEFYVKDTGIGIPNDRMEAIFERFIQADIDDKKAYQGAGLGLAITKAYVEKLGGKIWVECNTDEKSEGKGSIFYFTIPYKAERPIIPIEDNFDLLKENIDIRKLKILIAEDDDVSELLLEETIKTFSKEIQKVRTGVEAVEVSRNNPDIDLILMDIRMPDMNGYQATQQIRKFDKEVVIIAQTAYGLSGDKEKAIKEGCNDYISKPLNKTELLTIIQKYF